MYQTVMLYACKATFVGEGELPYESPPEIGSSHKCILFVRQADNEVDAQKAASLLTQYGWSSVVVTKAAAIQPESLNDPSMQVFQRHYEECLEQGDSLVWYP